MHCILMLADSLCIYVCMYGGCPLWNAHGIGHPTGPWGGAHQKWVQCSNPAVPLIQRHARWFVLRHVCVFWTNFTLGSQGWPAPSYLESEIAVCWWALLWGPSSPLAIQSKVGIWEKPQAFFVHCQWAWENGQVKAWRKWLGDVIIYKCTSNTSATTSKHNFSLRTLPLSLLESKPPFLWVLKKLNPVF